MSSSTTCQHRTAHRASVAVTFIEDQGRFTADLRVECADCGQPFRFLGLPMGYDVTGAAVSVDGEEARLALHPANEEPPSATGLKGFSVKVVGGGG